MTHQEAIEKLIDKYHSQAKLARAMGVSPQAVQHFKSKGKLPLKYWHMVDVDPTVRMYSTPAAIDVNTLTVSQAKALYEQLKEIFA